MKYRCVIPVILLSLLSSLCEARTPEMTFHATFDGTVKPAIAGGNPEPIVSGVRYEAGKEGQAVRVEPFCYTRVLSYEARGNLDIDQGTAAFWYKPEWTPARNRGGTPGRMFLWTGTPPCEGGPMLHLFEYFKTLRFAYTWPTRITVPINWQNKEWHHIAATWDGATGARLYLDGKLAGEKEGHWTHNPSPERFYVGSDAAGNYDVEGPIDDFKLFATALKPEEVTALYEGKLQTTSDGPLTRLAQAPPPTNISIPSHLVFSLNFDNDLTATTQDGSEKPSVCEGTRLVAGVKGQALDATQGIKLAYPIGDRLNKNQGTLSYWYKSHHSSWDPPFETTYLTTNEGVASPVALKVQRIIYRYGCGLFQWLGDSMQLFWDGWYEPEEWRHVAFSWKDGRIFAWYIDGVRQYPPIRPPAMKPQILPSAELLWIGSDKGGLTPADGAIDELMIWDQPVTDETIAAEVVGHKPLVLDLVRRVWEVGEKPQVQPRFVNQTNHSLKITPRYRVINSSGESISSGEIPSSLLAVQGGYSFGITLPANLAEGLYRLTCGVKEVPAREWSQSFMIGQPSVGRRLPPHERSQLKKVLVDEIDCASEPMGERLVASPGAHVVESPMGRYLETGPFNNARFAIRLKVKHPGRPHYLSLEVPDDKTRIGDLTYAVDELWAGYYVMSEIAHGYILGGDYRLTKTLRDYSLLLFPRGKEICFTLMTWQKNEPAAAGRIRLYEVEEDLPHAEVNEPAGEPKRQIGLEWEQNEIVHSFGGSKNNPQDAYLSVDRLMLTMGFAGLNLANFPIAWYEGATYPSILEGYQPKCPQPVDFPAYMLALGERRGIGILPDLFCVRWTPALKKLHEFQGLVQDNPIVQVHWDGTVSNFDYGGPPVFNPIHPFIQNLIREQTLEVARRYANFKSLRGVSLIVGGWNALSLHSVLSGYEDYTVKLFEKETGIKVPVSDLGPHRFNRRFRFLMKEHPKEWIAWRCRKLKGFYSKLADDLQRVRPDLRLYLSLWFVPGADNSPNSVLRNVTQGDSMQTIYREAGIDTDLFRESKNVVVRPFIFLDDCRRQMAYGSPPEVASQTNDLNLFPTGLPSLCSGAELALGMHRTYFETPISRCENQPLKGFWYKEVLWRNPEPAALGRDYLRNFALMLADRDLTTITEGGLVVTTMGHEEELREFARAFRALPARKFTDRPDVSDPVRLRELVSGGRRYFYLVNREPYALPVTIAFSGKARVIKAATCEDMKTDNRNGRMILETFLDPYELQSFIITSASVTIQKVEMNVPPSEISSLKAAVLEVQTLAAKDPGEAPDKERVSKTLAEITRELEQGHFSRVRLLLTGHALVQLRTRLGLLDVKYPTL